MDLSVRISELEGWALARVDGEVDIATAPLLRERLIGVITGGQPRIVLDLDGVTFLDSTGLGVIVGVLKRARTLGGDVRLVCNQPGVRKVFEITALDRTMPLADSPAAALDGTPTAGA
ncbi:MAG TPA: STAS domain-containing protein [Acidimicrobiales bacterium]|nr:STAS domain-containing protein [Acidimicrobiales bacterium]